MTPGTLLAVAHGTLLQGWGSLAAATGPTPSPSPSTLEIPPEDQTSPGLLGFLVTFAAAAAVIFLAFSLVRHLRVVDRNARRLQAERDGAASGDAPAGGAAGDGAPTADGDPGGTTPPGRR
ncbi:hypothetical protein [Cellulomonas pakistanensis]|uniref:Uncharacterized protein n=1 Tax=Cellulomonas pakistanensis TaxID=992287 RepID=A0A919PG61_9CELL|nr:hypothetical protein [Cellulomonas pakistanensis]GIG37912.1 hypothetical protein Cpa01nite_32930 [Cellulomonas pakistanensis]